MDKGIAAILTLSHEVNEALEPEVSGFMARGCDFNKENFEANVASLDRVFCALKDFGLIKDYEPRN